MCGCGFSHDNGSLLVDHQLEEERRSAEITRTGMCRIRTLTYDKAMACHKGWLDEAAVCCLSEI